MKSNQDAEWKPHNRTINRWHAWSVSLLTLAIFMGPVSLVQAVEDENLPQLPSIEVRPQWQLRNLTAPVLAKAVVPHLVRDLTGTEVLMTFKIGKLGKPYAIRYDASLSDYRKRQLGEVMRLNLKNWKFTPAVNKQGDAVSVKMVLPVKVMAPEKSDAESYASITLAKPVLLAVLDR